MGDPREKAPDQLQAELGLFHIEPKLGWNPQLRDNKQFRVPKISILNHSATGEGVRHNDLT